MGKRLPHCPGQKLIDRIPTTTQTPTALHPTPPQALALQIKKNRKRSRVRERRGGEEKKKRAVSPRPFSSGFLCAFDLPRTIYHRSEEKGKRKKKGPAVCQPSSHHQGRENELPSGRAAVAAAASADSPHSHLNLAGAVQ